MVTSALIADLTATPGQTAPVIGPFTGEPLHELPRSTASDVADAYAAARIAQTSWNRVGAAYRRTVLLRAHDLLLERQEHILDILQTETGKARGHAYEEFFEAATVTRYNALAAPGVLRARRTRAGIPGVIRTWVGYEPKGVVGVITPWNYPIALGAMDVVPALAAGNGVVQKADDQGALSILALRKAFVDAGVPAALWAVVAGDGGTVGDAVVDGADYVSFTGSTKTGTSVGVRAAGSLIGASLELGGKNPLIVLDDVDPEAAAHNAVHAVFAAMGQLCMSIERIYVQRPVADRFTNAFVAATEALKQGSALDYSVDLGSLATSAQLDRVQSHVADAVGRGATVLTGGKTRPELGPLFYRPTVLAGVTSGMACFADETFGPVVAITVVDSEQDAVDAANDTRFGLNAAVFSRSTARAKAVANRLRAGSVNINDGYRASFSSTDAPMGGMKQSGLGRRNGRDGLLRFVEARTISEATGLITLPRTGEEFAKLAPLMTTLLKAMRLLRMR